MSDQDNIASGVLLVKITRRRIVQLIIVLLVEAVTLLLMQTFMSGIQVESFRAAFWAAIVISIAQAIFWFIFIQFFAWLPTLLYPLITFVLNGLVVMLVANRLVPGIEIDSIWTGIAITVILTLLFLLGGAGAIGTCGRLIWRCPVCDRTLLRPGRYCGACGSRV